MYFIKGNLFRRMITTHVIFFFQFFLGFAKDPYNSMITSPTPFMGNHGEIFQLVDGTIWQVQYEYEYLYEYWPDVIVCPAENKLIIKGKCLSIRTVSSSESMDHTDNDFIESYIDGDFNGWDGSTIFKLDNGQIWQQKDYEYTYSYSYRPKVIIFSKNNDYYMSVDGISSTIRVQRLK